MSRMHLLIIEYNNRAILYHDSVKCVNYEFKQSRKNNFFSKKTLQYDSA